MVALLSEQEFELCSNGRAIPSRGLISKGLSELGEKGKGVITPLPTHCPSTPDLRSPVPFMITEKAVEAVMRASPKA
jgi:hypothetical protein